MAVLSSKVILPVEVLGAVNVTAGGALSSSILPVGSTTSEINAHRMLNTGLGLFDASLDAPKNLIHAFNMTAASLDEKQATIGPSSRLDPAMVGDGSVDLTEFTYLNGVTSAIQTQLNTKIALSALAVTDGGGDGSLDRKSVV